MRITPSQAIERLTAFRAPSKSKAGGWGARKQKTKETYIFVLHDR